jgi:hypothetical protein
VDPEHRSSTQDPGDRADMTAGGATAAPSDRGDGTTPADRSDGTTNGAGGGASMIQPDAAPEPGLLSSSDESRYRQTWRDVQGRFVDDPHEAVRAADALVAEVIQSLAQRFSEHKGRLESQWQQGGRPDTEELRQALQRYRDFFDRLLAT